MRRFFIPGLFCFMTAFAQAAPVANPAPAGRPVPAQAEASHKPDPKRWTLQKHQGGEAVYRARGRVIVLLRKSARAHIAQGAELSRHLHRVRDLGSSSQIASFDEDTLGFDALKTELLANPDIAAVEPDLRLRSSGRNEGPLKAESMDFRHAQHARFRPRIRQGGTTRKVRVGILDTGLDYLHPDLDDAVERGVNLIYKPGVDSTGAPAAPEDADSTEMDYNGHGTEVAGIIGAERNDIGIDGLADAKLVGIKAFDREGQGRLSDVIQGIYWAMDHGVEILNLSFGTYERSEALETAVGEALAKGMVLVAAAGNDHAGQAAYPARIDGVLSVGSLDEEGEVSSFSNFGPEVRLFAPGERIMSTSLRGEWPYRMFSGTSAACAHVAGLVALGLSEGAKSAAAVSALTATSENRLAFLDAAGGAFRSVHTDAYLATLRKQKVSRLSLAGLGANRLIWATGETPELRFRIQNTGTEPTPKLNAYLAVTCSASTRKAKLTAVPSLKPGEAFDGIADLPKAEADASMRVRIDLDASAKIERDGFDREAAVEILAAKRRRLYATALWLNDLEPGINPARAMIITLANIGNTPSNALKLTPEMRVGGHCEAARAPANRIGADMDMPGLKPGESTSLEIPVPDLDIPTASAFSILATLTDGVDTVYRPKKQLTAIEKGMLRPYYAQEVHRWIAREAVNLLRSQGVYIKDLMSPTAPYLGGVKPYYDIDEKFASFNLSYADYWPDTFSAGWTAGTLVNGAHDADETDIAFQYTGTDLFDTHFWSVDVDDHTGHTYGSLGHHHHSALDRIRALMYGTGSVSDSKVVKGALDQYRHGNKAAAWYFLGHIVHLIGDLSVPSHIDDDNWHGVWGDGYHDWMDIGNYNVFGDAPTAKQRFGGYINPYQAEAKSDPVRFLAYTTAQVGNSWSFGEDGISNHEYGKDGNRVAGGDLPHYDTYMNNLYAKMIASNREIGLPDIHPLRVEHINKEEVRDSHWGGSTCEWDGWMCTGSPCYEWYTDCKEGDGHTDVNNSLRPGGDGPGGNGDRDLEAIARFNVNYAISAAAGMIYYFAKETGQVNTGLPAMLSLLLN